MAECNMSACGGNVERPANDGCRRRIEDIDFEKSKEWEKDYFKNGFKNLNIKEIKEDNKSDVFEKMLNSDDRTISFEVKYNKDSKLVSLIKNTSACENTFNKHETVLSFQPALVFDILKNILMKN